VVTVEGDRVVSVRGDADDGFSEGYICPKGVALKELHEDPDRLRKPQIREGTTWREATWDEAFQYVHDKLTPIVAEHGKHAVGAYLGNPTIHNVALTLYAPVLLKALGSKNIFSASTVDQYPKQLACALMFGTGLSVPIPDIDRCDHFVILGANPLVSNGSLMTAPNYGARMKRLQDRGGKIVCIDPKRTKTAKASDEHHFIKPGTDAWLLFAMVHVLFEEGLVAPGKLEEYLDDVEVVRELAADFTPDRAAVHCGIDAETIRRMTREFAAADRAALYGRIGTCTQRFGTVTSWLVEVIHCLTGNLDREGGAMFTLPAHGPGNTKGTPGQGRGHKAGRWTTRVSKRSEVFGELPVACLAEEIETPGDGQIRAMFTVAGNPVLSTPNGKRLAAALESLDFMVSLDVYRNETTQYADVILPGLSPLETPHYDFAFAQLAIQDWARYSWPVFEPAADAQREWQTVLRLVGILSGMGPDADTGFLDAMVMNQLIQREARLETSAIHGREPEEIQAALGDKAGPERMADFMLRTGPYGEGFGANPEGLTLDKVVEAGGNMDLGPMKPRVPEVLRTKSGKIELAPELVVKDVGRLLGAEAVNGDGLLLIGRRHLRSNNSWMHNVPSLVTGKARCTLQMNPKDAAARGLTDGTTVRITSRVGSIDAPVEILEDLAPGVVSLPHGWGHADGDVQLAVARDHAGVNTNILTDEAVLDEPSGTAVLSGIPVEVVGVG
jgi:anaerobic selenocysteine-containing dehydrogenase